MDLSNNIVATEEIRDSLALEFNGTARADEVAADLVISVSTARRHLDLLVARGWATRRTTHGPSGRYGAVDYTLTAEGLRTSKENEGL